MSKLFKNLWYGLDLTRKIILNLVFFLIFFFVISAIISSDDKPKVEKGVALVLQPEGIIVEQLTYKDPIEAAMEEAAGNDDPPETLIYDLIEAIENAKDDDRITALVISTKYLYSAGLSKLQNLSAAIEDFKTSGKKVIAFDDNFSQTQYHLAIQADEVIMSPAGAVMVTGFSRVGTYFKSLLDNLEVNVNVFRVGTFKSAVEPFIRDNMSEEAKQANREWLGDLWGHFVTDIAARREMTNDDLLSYINNFKENIKSYNGDMAKLALDKRLVDSLMTRIEFRNKMIELVGMDDSHKSFKQISHKNYLRAIKGPIDYVNPRSEKVAVIVAKGNILDGEVKEGNIGGDTVSRIIRKTRLNDKVKAIVLRVDSGGGSAFASEVIREELVKAQEDGIKVVVSMGDVAASGGYWIAATADEIWARPTTITGSIGIFGMIPTFEKPFNKYGVFRDGIGTSPYANPVDPLQPLSDDVAEIIQTSINMGYQRFLELVAKGRNMTVEQVDEIAQGRVWSGEKAHEIGLVDQLGSLDDAIASAAKLAGIEKYDTWFVKRELSEKEMLLKQLLGNSDFQAALEDKASIPSKRNIKSELLYQVSETFSQLTMWNDPNHAYAACLCEIQ